MRGFSKRYRLGIEHFLKSVEAVQAVSFTVPEGALYGFIGPNGAGKSTTIKTLMGLLRPSSGTVRLMGLDPRDPASRREVGFQPEQPWFYDHLSGLELLQYYGRLAGLSGSRLQRRIEESCALCKVEESWLSRRLRTYSKGMSQRLGLAQAILHQPRLLILDEPMSGLDPMGRRDVREAMKTLHGSGTTIFYSSHVLSDVEEVCTHAAMLVRGTLRVEGTLSALLDDPSDPGHRGKLEDILAREVESA
ncbi:MAG: ABC transporter ATP-binding protein [Fibrobacteria bacterium]|nr:ABC transporter ATP-binding protein [Fibrobacteria bacterium]